MRRQKKKPCELGPLEAFYARAGLQFPKFEALLGARIPEPYRSLLVHRRDMTPTLEKFYRRTLRLHVLEKRSTRRVLARKVVLLPRGKRKPVEFGAIRIALDCFAPAARAEIMRCRTPLGTLLRTHAIPHACRPTAFVRVQTDEVIRGALHLNGRDAGFVYGRCNTLVDARGRILAEIVELLPPDGQGK